MPATVCAWLISCHIVRARTAVVCSSADGGKDEVKTEREPAGYFFVARRKAVGHQIRRALALARQDAKVAVFLHRSDTDAGPLRGDGIVHISNPSRLSVVVSVSLRVLQTTSQLSLPYLVVSFMLRTKP